MSTEARARIKVNHLLDNAGWQFFDTAEGKANIALEASVKIDAVGDDFEHTKNGFIDYLLLDKRGDALCVVEAKREERNPLDGKEQARGYAKGKNARYIILTNGNIHYLWDLEAGNPQIISKFPDQSDFSLKEQFKPDRHALIREVVGEDYIAITQNPLYAQNPSYLDEKTRKEFIESQKLRLLRPYQIKAVQALQDSVKKGNDRFLFEMATGTGKTLTAAAIIKLFLRTGNATRVLFLVDRLELEDQAEKNFKDYLKNDYTTKVWKQNREDWRDAAIVVTTVQSLLTRFRDFSPLDFDLVISDEAHRSIGGNARAVFEPFVGFKLGLTATPKDYIKNTDTEALLRGSPAELEKRQILDTYKTFGCESGDPTFRYSLLDGVKEGYLVNPYVLDARTEITTQLLSDEGYAVVYDADNGDEVTENFVNRDFEKKFFSDKTNRVFCETFLEHALKDPITGEIGKTIMFCVSQNHAMKITEVLNAIADKAWPGRYRSDFALQVTSRITGAQGMTKQFANNKLNGESKLVEGYETSKTRVCVTVGMMTTGYDCQDILNLCLMRPIFSPTEFVQMKGRGTRKYNFKYEVKLANGERDVTTEPKTTFRLFDFFGNVEFFEHKFDYDERLKLPLPRSDRPPEGEPPPRHPEGSYVSERLDPLKDLKEIQVGLEGLKPDRMLFQKFEETVKNDPVVTDNYMSGNLAVVKDYIRREIFEKPEEYFNLEKIRKALGLDRKPTIEELLDHVFQKKAIPSREELLDLELESFIQVEKPDPKYYGAINRAFKAYLTDPEVQEIMRNKEYGRLATNPMLRLSDVEALNGYRDIIPQYIDTYVSLNNFLPNA
ncbi:MAG: DEAD/DEAH box helicase family protein [Bacteroidota bacterium]|nr:DEAD/DEAH box helicase family protein [Bacteroidota bacterium]MDP4234117.1 DEAD/DEAH box helicase family protein [Bacteroidota bacterium]MDP4243058.1 DEAD/DEAH box helicase family protein [Bacteroidota bacterium]MDP4287484.1 DEAD/DEAH box helicase family protein [Bacteroidota bacterium]